MPTRTTTTILIGIVLVLANLGASVPRSAAQPCLDWIGRITSPGARYRHAMAYDSARGVAVLFGGFDTAVRGDTHEWNGNAWAPRHAGDPAGLTAPSARSRHCMAYDSARGVTVLFGGSNYSPDGGQTWEWDGTSWSLQDPGDPAGITAPMRRRDSAMVYDSIRHVCVLFGGYSGYLNDTWEWDGASWTRRAIGGPAPSPRAEHAMAFDSFRGVTVLFGGEEPTSNETWEWDGTTWTRRFPANAPSGRFYHAMAYDEQRRVTVLFGGVGGGWRGDTWEWNGTNWSLRHAGDPAGATAPSPRAGPAMVYDTVRHVVILTGGAACSSATWEWDGTAWTRRTDQGPAYRLNAAIAWDEVRGQAVLSGGAWGEDIYADTWAWDGDSWSRRSTTGPGRRAGAAMTFDRTRGVCLLFGGWRDGTPLRDLWQWNGTAWSYICGTGPVGRFAHAMTFDTSRGVAVLFGGFTYGGTEILNDTWEWNGTGCWQQRPASGPSARLNHAMAFDEVRSQIVLFGGRDSAGAFGDTWSWDGTGWTEHPVTGPSPRSDHEMVYDSTRAVIVLFGGGDNSIALNDVWDWDGTQWTERLLPAGPSARASAAMGYDRTRQRVVLFGGSTGGGETWELGCPPCPADFDGDGFLTGLDFDAYVVAFEAGETSADFDGDGFITGLDFDAYVVAFEGGC